MLRFCFCVSLCCVLLGGPAVASNVSVKEETRYYSVSGKRIQSVVKAMMRKGPWFDELNVRALALADYSYKTQVKTERKGNQCRVKSVRVNMNIVYILPRLSSSAHLSRKDASSWKRISNMIANHEKRHGRYYRQLASNVQRALHAMKPQKSCSSFRKMEREVRKKLELADKRKNQFYDRASYKGIYRRLDQLAPYWRKRGN